jgi:hypothetical protein
MNKTQFIESMNKKLPLDFIQSATYTVIEPGLSYFNKDQTITHYELLLFLKDNDLNCIAVLPDATFN